MITNNKYANHIADMIDTESAENVVAEEIKAVVDYSQQFNKQFSSGTQVEIMYMLLGAKKCIANMEKALFAGKDGAIMKERYRCISELFDAMVTSVCIAVSKKKGSNEDD